MRVAVNGWFLSHLRTGSGQYTHYLIQALLALPDAPVLTLVVPAGAEADALLPGGVALESVVVPSMWRGPLRKIWFEQIGFPRACERLGVDVAHVPYWGSPLRSPVPVIVTIHDLIPLILPAYHGGPLNRLYTGLVSASAGGASAILTDSDASRADIMRRLGSPPERVTTVYLAAAPQFVARGPGTLIDKAIEKGVREKYGVSEWYVFYVGGFDVRKNLDTLLRAYTYVLEGMGDTFPLVIAGKLPGKESRLFPDIKQAMRHYKLAEDEVLFIGEVDDGDLPALYRQAECFVYPSRYEGFGLPPLEAMSCGTPVVTTQTSSLPEIVGDAGFLVEPDDARKMAGAILAVLVNDDLAQDLRQRGLAQARRFSWQRTAQETLTVYQRVLAGTTPKTN